MDYEKRYKEAIKRARQFSEHPLLEDSSNIVEYIFPELKESEDNVREKLLSAFKSIMVDADEDELWYGLSYNDIIAWLEKQGEKKHKFIIGDIISNNKIIYRVDNIVKNAIGQDCYCLVDVKSEKDGTRYLKLDDSDGKFYNNGEITWVCKQVDAKFEKQDKQKPINDTDEDIVEAVKDTSILDIVKRKFHKGDWIAHDAANFVFQVTSVGSHGYEVCNRENHTHTIIFDNEGNYHLWTITDAKDCDVLSDGTTIFIFKELLSDGSVMSYCDYDTDSGESDAFYPLSMNLMCSKINPATKEQHDLLLQKMHDEGYEWNAEKRELKKIEQKYSWSEEDENMLKSIIATCKLAEQDRDSSPARHLYEMQTNWLKSLKERIKGE